MPYATVQQVAARCRSLQLPTGQFTSETFVRDSDVLGWLEEAEVKINQVVKTIGGSPPYTDPAAQSILGDVILLYAEGMVYSTIDKANNNYRVGSVGYTLLEQYKEACKYIMQNQAEFLALLNESSPSRFRSHVAHNTKGRSISNGDFEPRIKNGTIDTGF